MQFTTVLFSLTAVTLAALPVVHTQSTLPPYTTYTPDGTFTTYVERTVHLLTNALRVSPNDYLSLYSNSVGSCAVNGASVGTLNWQKGLTNSGRFHCQSMFNSKGTCFQHDTCPADCGQFGSCDWAKRVWFFYKLALIGENLAVGYQTPFSVMDAWLNSPGHCSNLIGGGYTEMGVSSVLPYICQDFGGAVPKDYSFPVVMGSHFSPLSDNPVINTVQFSIVYDSSIPVQYIKFWIDGRIRYLGLTYGSANKGFFTYKPDATDQAFIGSQCRRYYFVAYDVKGNSFRFPQVGYFFNFALGGCSYNYGQ